MGSQVLQNFHMDCEVAINDLVNMELCANYVYLSGAYFFDRDDVALHHFKTFSKNQSDEKLEHAQKFLKYLNKRGGHIVLQDIKKPERDDWRNSLEVLEIVLQMEKKINQALLNLHNLAMEKSDPHLCDFLEREYLDEQVTIIKCLGDYITNLRKLGVPGSGLGEYLFDKLTLGDSR
ncbi:ferritin heavy chain A-like [Phascolarctos cinereus]|uniref:Ferritin n=1 Tax=Phascolarctos cinereus TaxID=38626 RepID=A0A6P5J3K9_PHACI|nr:ferritin heavy chain A-like [Phascolarctos cinereus]